MIDATRFRLHPQDFVDADLKAIHGSPGTDTRDMQ
jgi:hypothetical protein